MESFKQSASESESKSERESFIESQVFKYYRSMRELNTPGREAFQLAVEFKNKLEKKYGM